MSRSYKKPPYDFKKVITVQEQNDDHLLYEVVVKGDDSGWYKKADLIPRGACWSKNYVDKSMITMEYFDGHLVVRIRKHGKPDNVFELSISDLADFRILAEATMGSKKKNGTRWYPKAKIIDEKEFRKKKK